MGKETAAALRIGTDFEFPFTIKNGDESTCINITGWALSFIVKRREEDTDAAALLHYTVGAGIVISGSFNADPSTNTQVATVTVADSDTDGLHPGLRYYELKRTDAGLETVLAFGRLDLIRSVHRT